MFQRKIYYLLGTDSEKKSVGSKDGFQNYEPNQGFFAKKKIMRNDEREKGDDREREKGKDRKRERERERKETID